MAQVTVQPPQVAIQAAVGQSPAVCQNPPEAQQNQVAVQNQTAGQQQPVNLTQNHHQNQQDGQNQAQAAQNDVILAHFAFPLVAAVLFPLSVSKHFMTT